MKQLYTSYYAKSGKHALAASISLSSPSFFRTRWIPELAPSPLILKGYKAGVLTNEDYEELYLDLLINDRKLDAQRIVDQLPEGTILLCYEKSGDFCHRHIAARWLMENADVTISEIVDPPKRTIVDELLTF